MPAGDDLSLEEVRWRLEELAARRLDRPLNPSEHQEYRLLAALEAQKLDQGRDGDPEAPR